MMMERIPDLFLAQAKLNVPILLLMQQMEFIWMQVLYQEVFIPL